MMKILILMPITISMTRYYHKFKLNSNIHAVLKRFHKIFISISVLTIALLVTSCEENPATIGKELLPGNDFVSVKSTDTLSIFAYTAYDGRERTDGSNLSYLGNLSDPYFGDTKADFVAQLRLDTAWRGSGAITVDSVKFFMAILPSEGSVVPTHYISLYEATDYLNKDSVYYSDKVVHKGLNFGTYPIPAMKVDTVTTVVIPLPTSVGEYLLRDTLMLFHSNTVPDFRSFFKGLYVTLQDSPDPLFLTTFLTSTDPTAGILVYFQNKKGTGQVFPFIINDKSVVYNRYSHDFTKASADKKILNIDKIIRNEKVKDSVTYLQNYDGVYTRIEIPGLKELKALMPIAVSKTRLWIPVYFDEDSLFKPSNLPSKVLVRYKTAAGVKDTIPDFNLSTVYVDGSYNKASGQYVFNMAVFTQLYLEGKIPEPVLEMFLPVGSSNNLIFKMNDNSHSPKLEFTYSNF